MCSTLSLKENSAFQSVWFVNFEVSGICKVTSAGLNKSGETCDGILLAADYDREGESIAWHVSEVLKIPISKRKRLLFTEITKKALLDAAKNPKDLDINMFYAQQARRIIDRLIGYKITPLLWKNIQMLSGSKL